MWHHLWFHRKRFAALTILFSGTAFSQPAPAKLTFDLADVHSSPRKEWVKDVRHPLQGDFLIGDRYELHRATMLDLIRLAYNVDADSIFGGPSWIDYDRYEVIAKTKPGASSEMVRQMLRSLLADRFHLAIEKGVRDVPGYLLSKGSGNLAIRPAADTGKSLGCQSKISIEGGSPRSSLECRGVTMAAFAAALRPRVGAPVGESTGLEGGWDIDLVLETLVAGSGKTADAAVMDSVAKVGLKLQKGSVPLQVWSVQSVDRQPTANPPAISEVLPPLPPPRFEVAAIKWPCEGNMTMATRFESGGRITAMCMPLVSLITQAWGLANFEQPLGVPKWLSDSGTKYNISLAAKAPEGMAVDPAHNLQARDILNQMLRQLLIDRYQLKFHFDDQPRDSHTLVANKPKLTKADPAGRTGCKRQNQPQQGLTTLTCTNMTMAQFAEQIPAYDQDVFYPVLDATAMEGAWDFTINYDPIAGLSARFPLMGARTQSPDGQAADPSGSISFTIALEKQLGLKLEVHKRPQPVLVIDHIEEKPSDN